jgi:hypothetical protein
MDDKQPPGTRVAGQVCCPSSSSYASSSSKAKVTDFADEAQYKYPKVFWFFFQKKQKESAYF